MTRDQTCPHCGAPIDPEAYGGLCPACLIGVADLPPSDGGSADAPTPEDLNRALPEFEVTEIIGRGGMGTVYRAHQFDLDREVAIKLMTRRGKNGSADSFADRFAREAQVTAKLDHPAVVPVYNIGFDTVGRCYYTMRLVTGRDFATIITLVEKGGSSWSLTRALGVLVRVCQAIAYAHAKGVIHRDIKPPNIMVGDLGEVYVLDWGLAKFADHEDLRDIRLELGGHQRDEGAKVKLTAAHSAALRTIDGAVIGTPAYMSPEQAAGRIDEVDHLADVYSLGAMLYHLLARHPPYMPGGSDTTPEQVLSSLLERSPEKLPELRSDSPAELISICEKAMARDRTRRYGTALALAEDIQAYLDDRVVGAYESGGIATLRKWAKRNRALASSAALTFGCLVAALVAIAVVQTRAKRDGERALKKETTALQNEQLARLDAQINLADAYTRAGLAAADRSHFARGQLWFTLAAEAAAHDPHRITANRMRAKTYGQAAPIPVRVVDGLPSMDYNSIVLHPTLPYAMVEDWQKCRWRAVDFENERSLKFQTDGWFSAAAFDPSSDRIAVSHAPGKVEIRSMNDRKLLASIDLGTAAGTVNSLAFSPDGKRLFIGTREARIWESVSAQLLPQTLHHDAPPDWSSFSGNGEFVMTCTRSSEDHHLNTVRAFSIDPEGGGITPCLGGTVPHRTRAKFKCRPSFVGSDGRRILSLKANEQAVIWDTLSGKEKQEFRATITDQVTPDGRLLFAGTEIRDLKTGRVTSIQSHGPGSFSPDQSMAACSSSRYFLSTADGRRLGGEPPLLCWNWKFVHWDGATCVIGSHKNGKTANLTLWRLPVDSRFGPLPIEGRRSRSAYSPDGRHAAPTGNSFSPGGPYFPSINATRVYDLTTSQPASAEIRPGQPILDTAFSPDGEILALAIGDPTDSRVAQQPDEPLTDRAGRIEFWNWKGGQRLDGRTVAMRSEPHRIAYHPDGWLAALCADGDVVKLEAAGQAPVGLFQVEKNAGLAKDFRGAQSRLYFAEAGKVLIAGSLWAPEKFHVWDIDDNALKFSVPGNDSAVGGDVFMSGKNHSPPHPFLFHLGNGSPLDTGDFRLQHPGNLSADGRFILSGGFTNRVRIWDWQHNKRVGPDLGDGDWHTGAFLNNTPWVVTASTGGSRHYGGMIRMWDLLSGMPVAPPIQLGNIKYPRIELSQNSAFGTVNFGLASICLDLRSLLSSDWPMGNLSDRNLLRLAEINAFETYENGQLRMLEVDEWVTLWKEFRARHPDFHRIRHADPARLARYHQRRAGELQQIGNAYGAAWHRGKSGR